MRIFYSVTRLGASTDSYAVYRHGVRITRGAYTLAVARDRVRCEVAEDMQACARLGYSPEEYTDEDGTVVSWV